MPHDSSLAATGKVKILEYLPRFMGRDGEVLGPFEAGAVVVVDAQIAGLLVKKGRAEPV
jgi:hypothetical protein